MRWGWEWREMGVRWKWKWNESYLTRTRGGGTQQKRGGTKRNTHTKTPGPERANPEKARERKKRGPTEERTKTRRGGGRTEAPEQTYTSENKTCLRTHGPDLPGEGSTHEIRHIPLSHNIFNTHRSHTSLSHPTLSHTHTQLCHTHPCYTPSLPHTLFHAHTHTQLCHAQHCHTRSFTHNFVTHYLLSRTTL